MKVIKLPFKYKFFSEYNLQKKGLEAIVRTGSRKLVGQNRNVIDHKEVDFLSLRL